VTGRLPGSLAAPALSAVFSLIPEGAPSEMRLAALEAAARALLGQVRWGETAEEGDWEAVEEEGTRWLFREGRLVSLSPGGPGRARSLLLTDPERSFTVTWTGTGEWVAGPSGGEAWARLASGQVVPETEVLRHLEEGLERLEDKLSAAEEASLPETIPSDPTVPPRPWDEEGWGQDVLGEAGGLGGVGPSGLSAGSLTGLVAGAVRVVGQVAASRSAAQAMPAGAGAGPAEPPESARPPLAPAREPMAASQAEGPTQPAVAPQDGPSSRSAPVCPRCGQASVPGARFCKQCGTPLRVAICLGCQVPLPAGARFCKKCGRPVRPDPS